MLKIEMVLVHERRDDNTVARSEDQARIALMVPTLLMAPIHL